MYIYYYPDSYGWRVGSKSVLSGENEGDYLYLSKALESFALEKVLLFTNGDLFKVIMMLLSHGWKMNSHGNVESSIIHYK